MMKVQHLLVHGEETNSEEEVMGINDDICSDTATKAGEQKREEPF